LSGDATFLQRLFVGWTRSNGVNLVPFSEKERKNVCSQTAGVIFDVGARSRLFLSHHLSARGVRWFYLAFDRGKAMGAQNGVGASLVLSGTLRNRVPAEGAAALNRLS
jgi:hypothetical protein